MSTPVLDISVMNDVDAIGVVREHRRLKAKGQRERLQRAGVHRILDISVKGGHKREDLERLVRGGTVVALVHTFLLADPKSKNKAGGRRKDLLDAMSRIEKRGGTIKDVDSGLTTANNEHRYALIALATEQLARDGRGLRSHINGKLGRPVRTFPPEVWAKAEAIWNNRKLATWADTAPGLKALGLTPREAWRKFGART